ncbi:MAG: hypothetical protein II404_11000 [Prevotella sp.]|nr:hypothetical protein [Prevotella sp.]
MQDSYRQLIKQHWSIFIILVLTPILLYAVLPILPTHDDWAGTTKPDFNPFFIKEHFFFYGYHWRPFDTWIGYIVGRNPQVLWPTFNHVIVVIGHLFCSLSIYRLLTVLGFNKAAKNISTLFFFITPATMATVSAIDSQNQVYALTCGIIAFLFYCKLKKRKYIVWISLIFLATLFKENGLMWAWICPILAYGFDLIEIKTLKKDLLVGTAIMGAYALAILLLPKDITIHPEYVPEDFKVANNVIKFFFTSFITVDYIYLLHQPSRHLFLAALSFLLAAPFLYFIFIRQIRQFANKKIICTIICLLIAVAPHLGTVFSMMHAYAGLAMITIIIAFSINHTNHIKHVVYAFILWIIIALLIDIHLIDASVKSGLVGKNMAKNAIQKTGSPVDSVYVIIIEDDYPKLSSFCVIPNEAFGWGLAAQYETNYQWPKVIEDTTIERTADAFRIAKELGLEILNKQQHHCVWIVNHEHIDVIKK